MVFGLDRLTKSVERIIRDKPGERFCNYHLRRRVEGEKRWVSALYIGLGVILILIGGLLGLAPGLPGFFFGVPGIILIISRLAFVARWLDTGEVAARRFLKRFRKDK